MVERRSRFNLSLRHSGSNDVGMEINCICRMEIIVLVDWTMLGIYCIYIVEVVVFVDGRLLCLQNRSHYIPEQNLIYSQP